MRIDLLPRDGQFYKANLHSHSTLSDGQVTPAELKLMYKKKGYSVFAYTEHSNYYDLREQLDDKDFITLPSYEAHLERNYASTPFSAIYDGGAPTPNEAEAVHLNLFAIDPEKTTEAVPVKDIFDFSLENTNELIRRAKNAAKGQLCADILRAHDPSRILFATDTPWSDPAEELDFVRNAGLSEEMVDRILHVNAENLLATCMQ